MHVVNEIYSRKTFTRNIYFSYLDFSSHFHRLMLNKIDFLHSNLTIFPLFTLKNSLHYTENRNRWQTLDEIKIQMSEDTREKSRIGRKCDFLLEKRHWKTSTLRGNRRRTLKKTFSILNITWWWRRNVRIGKKSVESKFLHCRAALLLMTYTKFGLTWTCPRASSRFHCSRVE